MSTHGDIQIQLDRQLLYVRACGAFNLEGTRTAYSQIEAAAAQIYHQPWVKLSDFRECMLGGPECLTLIGIHNQWCLAHGCIGMALVVANAAVRDIYQAQTAASGLPLRIFTEPDSARQHLLALLAAHPPT